MKIRSYITEAKIKICEAADALEVSTQCLHQWISGKRVPQPEKMIAIYRWSGGKVQPNDFYELPDLSSVDALPLFARLGQTPSGGGMNGSYAVNGGS